MTAFAGSSPSATFRSAPIPDDRAIPGAHAGTGLVFGGIGALLLAIGGVGLPAALVTVSQNHLVGPGDQGALDAGMRLAPLLVIAGAAHLVAAVGLVAGRAWGRTVALGLTATVIVAGIVGMIAVGTGNDPLAPVGSSHAAAAAATGLSVLGFLVVGYAIAFVAVSLRRIRS